MSLLRALAGAASALVIVLSVTACGSREEPSSRPSEPSAGAVHGAPLRIQVAAVDGRLPAKARAHVRAQAGTVVDRWWRAAYLTVGDRHPFAAFTPGAAHLAARDADLLSNARLDKRISGATAVRRLVVLDVFAAKRRPRGVTARLHLTYDTTGDLVRRCAVGGTVSLVPDKHTWRIFGYDVTHACHAKGAKK